MRALPLLALPKFSVEFVRPMHVGLRSDEREAPQQVALAVNVWQRTRVWPPGSINDTWNYQGLADLIGSIGSRSDQHVDLLETVVHMIAQWLCDQRVFAFEIAVRKPNVFRCGGAAVGIGPILAVDYESMEIES